MIITQYGPDPKAITPNPSLPQLVFLSTLASKRPNVTIGAYTYYDYGEPPADPAAFFDTNILYHFDFIGDFLRIGRFCALAKNCCFLMNGGSHATSLFTTYPFHIFGQSWAQGFDPDPWDAENRGDTTIGHDVWIGRNAVIMPGIDIGSGAIIGSFSIVTKDVPPYSIVAGNPARLVNTRFDDATIADLLNITWWDWPIEKITKNLNAICSADLDTLKRASHGET